MIQVEYCSIVADWAAQVNLDESLSTQTQVGCGKPALHRPSIIEGQNISSVVNLLLSTVSILEEWIENFIMPKFFSHFLPWEFRGGAPRQHTHNSWEALMTRWPFCWRWDVRTRCAWKVCPSPWETARTGDFSGSNGGDHT